LEEDNERELNFELFYYNREEKGIIENECPQFLGPTNSTTTTATSSTR
jgi:hypothetical protein